MTRSIRMLAIPLMAMVGCSGESGPHVPGTPADGALVYQVCLGCHGTDGHGVAGGLAPSLVHSDLVTGSDSTPLIKLLLHGVENDGLWPGLMMPWRENLNDEQIAAVLTYIRSQWGNDAPPVTAEDVGRIREQTSDRTAPYPRDELRSM